MNNKIIIISLILMSALISGCLEEEPKDFSEMDEYEKLMYEKKMSVYFEGCEALMCEESGKCKESAYVMYEDASLIEEVLILDEYNIVINNHQLIYWEHGEAEDDLWVIALNEDTGIREIITCYLIIPDNNEERLFNSREPVGQYFILFIHDDTAEKISAEVIFKKDVSKIYFG